MLAHSEQNLTSLVQGAPVHDLAFGPNGHLFAAGGDGAIRSWSIDVLAHPEQTDEWHSPSECCLSK